MKNKQPIGRFLVMACLAVIIAIVCYSMLTTPDQRNGIQKIGDAVHELPEGTDKAVRELKDRTPAEKLSDTVKDAGKNLKDSVNQ